MNYFFYSEYEKYIGKEIAVRLKRDIRNYFCNLARGKGGRIDKSIAERFARRSVNLIFRAVAAPGRATRKEVSVGSIPIPPNLEEDTGAKPKSHNAFNQE